VTVTGNSIKQFRATAIRVKDSQNPAHVHGNTATSADPKARVADVQGLSGIVEDNVVKEEWRGKQDTTK
jgi:hypothetical protein